MLTDLFEVRVPVVELPIRGSAIFCGEVSVIRYSSSDAAR